MKAIVLPALLFFCGAHAQQTVVNVDKIEGSTISRHFYVVGGNPVSTAKYVKVVSGSPYFSDNKMLGQLDIYGGKKVDSILLRLDLLEIIVLYTIGDGVEMQATSPIQYITLKDPETNEQYRFTHSSAIHVTEQAVEPGWYQQIATGPVSLYKKINKSITETRPYNSATFEQSISTSSGFFLLTKNAFIQVKKTSTIPDILSDKKDALSAFLKQNRKTGKSDKDYIEIVDYYNKLQ